MENDLQLQIRELADIKENAEARLLRRLQIAQMAGHFIWFLGLCVVGITIWMAKLAWVVGANADYIADEKIGKVHERLHDMEESSKRRDRQIDKLNAKTFNYEP